MAVIKRFNNAFGTITDSPLSSTATTMNSDELPRLGVVDSANNEIARVTLDPERKDGAPEVIHVTSYDGTATSATIERGKEGTTARQHASGTTWEHAPTVEDINAGDSTENSTDSVSVGPTALTRYGARTIAIGHEAVSGRDSTSSGWDDNIGIGTRADAGNVDGIAIGRDSAAWSDSVAIGPAATISIGTGSVAIGNNASATDDRAVAIGEGSSAAERETVAIGKTADAQQNWSIALGWAATSSASGGVSIGRDAAAGHTDAVALGKDASTSAADQIHVGARHHAFSEITDPATPPADEARLYARDDGAGTTELVALFPSGNSTVLANGA